MISAMLVQGIQPGPLLITQHPEIFWGLIASAYIGNVMLLLLNIPMVGVWSACYGFHIICSSRCFWCCL